MLMQKQFRFAQLFLLLTHAATILAQGKVAVYWGQASGGSQKSLGDYCTDDVDIVILSFLNNFPSPWTLDFSSLCSEKFSDGVLHCSQIGSDIKKCQQKGKKVLLSLGGQNGKQGFSSDSEATDFAKTLWNAFGGGSSEERPFDDAKIDGFDFDVENKQQTGYVALAKKLKDYYSQDSSKKYYLSASPQCVYPDESVGDVLLHVPIDFAFIQFYNNNCNLDKSFNFDTWQKYAESAPNQDIELFIGLPGSLSAAGSGYVSTDVVKSTVQKVSSDKNFAGISLWDASAATSNTGSQGTSYLSEIKNILDSSSSSASSGSSSSGLLAAQSSEPSSQSSVQHSSSSLEQASSSLIPHQSIAQQGTESSSLAATAAGYNAAATAATISAASDYASTAANQEVPTSTSYNINVYGTLSAPQSNTIIGSSHQAVADDSVVEARQDSQVVPAPSSQSFKSFSNSSSSTTYESSSSFDTATGTNYGNKINAESVTSQGSAASSYPSQQSASVSESVSTDSTLTTTLRRTIMKAPFSNSTTNNGAHAAQTAVAKPTTNANNNKNSYHYSAMVVGPSLDANGGSNKDQSGSSANQSGSSNNLTISHSGSSNGQENSNQSSNSDSDGDTTTTIYSTISTTVTSKSFSNTVAPSSFRSESVTSQLNSTANITSSTSSAMSSGFVSLSSFSPSSTSANAQQKREIKDVAINSEAKASLTTVSWFSLLCLAVTSLF